jgi:hypothetical protein
MVGSVKVLKSAATPLAVERRRQFWKPAFPLGSSLSVEEDGCPCFTDPISQAVERRG